MCRYNMRPITDSYSAAEHFASHQSRFIVTMIMKHLKQEYIGALCNAGLLHGFPKKCCCATVYCCIGFVCDVVFAVVD